MTQHEFTGLTGKEQYKVMNRLGILIAERRDSFNKYCLFQVHSFYVEAKFDNNIEAIQGMRSFTSTSSLEPYLQNINITHLL